MAFLALSEHSSIDELLQLLPVLAKNEVPNLENHLKIEPEQDVSGPFSSPRRS